MKQKDDLIVRVYFAHYSNLKCLRDVRKQNMVLSFIKEQTMNTVP